MVPIVVGFLVFISVFHYKNQPPTEPINPDRIVVYKNKKILVTYKENQPIQQYPISLGYNPGKKERSGDGKTPEGHYYVMGKKEKSVYVHSLQLSYPNHLDKQHAKTLNVHPGDSITIHGTGDDPALKKSMKLQENWTRGCIGMHNHHIRELYRMIQVGTPVDIHP